MDHEITIDESGTGFGPPDGAWRAYCTDECGWAGRWQHFDSFDEEDDQADAAWAAAHAEGADHLAEQT